MNTAALEGITEKTVEVMKGSVTRNEVRNIWSNGLKSTTTKKGFFVLLHFWMIENGFADLSKLALNATATTYQFLDSKHAPKDVSALSNKQLAKLKPQNVDYCTQVTFNSDACIRSVIGLCQRTAQAHEKMAKKLVKWLEEFKAIYGEEYAALSETVEAIKADTKQFTDGSKHFEVRASGRLVSNILHVESCVYIVPITGHQYQTLEAAQYSLVSYYRAVSEENKQRQLEVEANTA